MLNENKLVILKPIIGGHEGSCFRELIDLWFENGFCNVVLNSKGNENIREDLREEARPWMNLEGDFSCAQNDILLYDNTRGDKLDYIKGWNKALFANEVLDLPNSSPWIWWVRFPRIYYRFQELNKYLNFHERNNESIFIGNYTNENRRGNWNEYISFFYMGNHSQHFQNNMQFNYNEYLKRLANSKFGLDLPGQGPKTLRFAEYCGLGVVPIITSGIVVKCFNEVKEGIHYFFAKNPKQVSEIINDCSIHTWQRMSINCIKWFEQK